MRHHGSHVHAELSGRGRRAMSSAGAARLAAWPAQGLEDAADCPVCGSMERVPLHDGLEDRTFGSAPGKWRLVRCTDCGSAHLDPRPTRESIGLAYRTYFTHAEDPGAAAPEGLRAALANGALNHAWDYEATPATSVGALVAAVAPSRAAIVARSVRHLRAYPGGRLLDVGSGSGAFVAQMQRLGWRAEGLEPDPDAVAVAREAGLSIMQGTVDDLDGEALDGVFDAVTLSHVIEHLHDPEEAVRRLATLLRPGGLLWIATPNLRSLGHRHFGRDWLALDPPRHLVLFTRSALEGLLRRHGLVPAPAPRPIPEAALTFPQSAAIRDGRPTSAGPARGGRIVQFRAALADLAAARDPERAEELVVIARRPG
jgi:SAM-dependent methyltransferase